MGIIFNTCDVWACLAEVKGASAMMWVLFLGTYIQNNTKAVVKRGCVNNPKGKLLTNVLRFVNYTS